MSQSTADIPNKLAELIRPSERPPAALGKTELDVLAFDLEERANLASIRAECGSGIEIAPLLEPRAPKPKRKKRKGKKKAKAKLGSEGQLTAKQQELADKVAKQNAKLKGQAVD